MRVLTTIIILMFCNFTAPAQATAKWITAESVVNKPNTWLAFRKAFNLLQKPPSAQIKVAADSKYWLWINGKSVVFEGGLKRGPNPADTYYDQLDIAAFLKKGNNKIEVLLMYFGKDGFSHKNSGQAGLLFNCPSLKIISNQTWQCKMLDSYQSAGEPLPNYRLSESSILFDAAKEDAEWRTNPSLNLPPAKELGAEGAAPWNKLILRPIPLFKDFGLKKYEAQRTVSSNEFDTIICKLPYNAQVTPYLHIDATEEGKRIIICTDNYLLYNAGAVNIRSEYLTKKGQQEFEFPEWMNGHAVYYIIPHGIRIINLKFRETGFNTEFTGSFSCSDPFFNNYWNKARRTLYVTMRDNFMDCPDRERAQWTGDAVSESGESFYALSPSAASLSKKWLLEIANWQRADGSLYSPVPSGNWNKELPGQSLATVGYYGLWNYYLNTGDKQTLAACYEAARKYLLLWEPNPIGTFKMRMGEWAWGDWGDNKDIQLIYQSFYYLAIKGMEQSALILGKTEDATFCSNYMTSFKANFNAQFWTGREYRHPGYKEKTDDRVQALAVVAGLADKEKYPALLEIFKTVYHASPYLEKYVFEALFKMGEVDFALERYKKRFAAMVNDDRFSTLWEGWTVNDPAFGGGTVNHAWSGGGLTVLSQYLCGVAPLTAGYRLFQIIPQPGNMQSASIGLTSAAGNIRSSFQRTEEAFKISAEVPAGSSAVIGIPKGYTKILINNQLAWQHGSFKNKAFLYKQDNEDCIKLIVKAGKWNFTAVR